MKTYKPTFTVSLRIPAEDFDRLARAARLAHQPLSTFIRESAMLTVRKERKEQSQ